MDKFEIKIRDHALLRLSKLLDVSIKNLKMSDYFCDFDIKKSLFFFKRNALDIILDDVRDVSDDITLRKIEDDQLSIDTVGEYLDHMVDCYLRNPDEVTHILKDLKDLHK